jgi:hypothetical protein
MMPHGWMPQKHAEHLQFAKDNDLSMGWPLVVWSCGGKTGD